jgi:hypothetical protein
MPGVAGLRMTIFPAGSLKASTPALLGKVEQELLNFLKMSGRTWDLRQSIESYARLPLALNF